MPVARVRQDVPAANEDTIVSNICVQVNNNFCLDLVEVSKVIIQFINIGINVLDLFFDINDIFPKILIGQLELIYP